MTVFSAGPLDGRVTGWDADTGVDSATRMVKRAAENDAALGMAGRRATNLGLREVQYDGGAVDLDLLRRQLAGADVCTTPPRSESTMLTRSNRVVRDACLAVQPDAHLYADNPYCHFSADIELPEGLRIGLRRVLVGLTPEQRERKAKAISCYAGEITKLEGILGGVPTRTQLKYEVFWEPTQR